jgi:hypothetical protein
MKGCTTLSLYKSYECKGWWNFENYSGEIREINQEFHFNLD